MMVCRKIFTIFILSLLVLNFEDANARSKAKKVRSRNPYLITNVFSSAEESAPSDSRIKATMKAHRVAFLVLLKNLGVEESFSDEVSDEEIADAVYSRRITDERIAGNYYSAKFNISFLKSTVSALLDNSEVQEDEIIIKEDEEIFLFFPVEILGNKPVLWERNNIWFKSIEESINNSNIRNIVMPRGDYSDIVNINLKNIQGAKYSDFNSMLTRYGANSAIIAYFDFDKIDNKANITLSIVRSDDIQKFRLGFVNSKNLSRSGLLLEVADRTIDHVASKSKSKRKVKKVSLASSEKLLLNVEISDLEEWMRIKSRIEDMYFIKSLKLESISRSVAKITITHSGDSSNIAKLFAKFNFLLRQNRSGEYFLSVQ